MTCDSAPCSGISSCKSLFVFLSKSVHSPGSNKLEHLALQSSFNYNYVYKVNAQAYIYWDETVNLED